MSDRKLYRKRPNFHVTAVQLDLDFTSFTYQKWGGEQHAKPGDWLVDNNGDVYTVAKDYFRDNYQRISQGVFDKIGEIWAEVAPEDGTITTLEGSTEYRKGHYLVYDSQQGGDGYAIEKAKFERMYEEVKVDLELTPEQQGYIDNRLGGIVERYKKLAENNQRRFYIWQVLTILAAALVPVLSVSADDFKWLIAALGGASAVSAGMLSLFKFQENWKRCETTYLDLESHIAQFKVGAGAYGDRKHAFSMLVNNCEKILNADRGQWAEQSWPAEPAKD